MSDDYGVRIIEVKCGNTQVHKEHEWRHGFLKLKKTKCEGRPPLTEDEIWKAANPNLGIINMDKVMSKEDRSLYDINRPEFQGNLEKFGLETIYGSYKLDADPIQSIVDWQAKWAPHDKTHNQSVAEKIIPLEQIDLDFNMSSHIGESRAVWNENYNTLGVIALKQYREARAAFAQKKVESGAWGPNKAREYLFYPEYKGHKHLFRITTHQWHRSLYLTWDCECGAGEERYRKTFYTEMLNRPWQ